MGMAANQLVANASGNRIEIEALCFPGDLRVEHHLQQQVAEFLLEILVVTMTDCIGHFVGLFQDIWHQRGMGLFQVPGAARCWIPQLCHDIDQSL